ncbi:MAG: class I tRNA ligase family protein [Planctomycetota bacterium]|nr:class I tRNA ligase family protein [Planctomycetota bacterium]
MTEQKIDAHGIQSSPSHRYDAGLANRIEKRWQQWWDEHQTYRTPDPGDADFDPDRPKFYCLDMFPYPSGAGLHVGHPEGYIGSDIISRYKRMAGFNVLHPMGFDAFGLPAEQYAVQTGVHPRVTTVKAIDNYRRQLKSFGFSYDWSRELATTDPDYYRWTQWIWLKAYGAFFDRKLGKARSIDQLRAELDSGARLVDGADWAAMEPSAQEEYIDSHRLAYLGFQTVNWCPKLGTVLANEEVIDGRSERGGFPVLRKPLRQWMFRITEYADRLLDDLQLLDWPESTRTMQREWIGRSEGASIEFPVGSDSLEVFTTRPDTLFGATYMVVAPEHPLVDRMLAEGGSNELRDYVMHARNRSDVDRMADSKEKTGVALGIDAINPATGRPIPVWTADYVLMGYGTGAIMAVPAHDERDHAFALAYQLPITRVVDGGGDLGQSACTGAGLVMASANEEISLDGLTTDEAKVSIIEWLEAGGMGRRHVNYKLRDWLFSRQRYWGEPFPIVYDSNGRHYPVSDAALPVTLPDLDDYEPIESDEPTPPLGKATAWVETTAGEAGVDPTILPPDTPVRRETNTMPGWAGSCWYYIRYCSPHAQDRFITPEAEKYWLLGDREEPSSSAAVPGEESFDLERFKIGGVDLYIGGAEHAVLHLLYARFWHKILFDLGEVSTPEPIDKLFHQGMITSFAYRRGDGSLVPIDEVEENEDGSHTETATGAAVEQIIAKMSKSLRNVVNPDDVVEEYGADTMRLYEMYMGPLEASAPWNTRDIVGVHRFLQRVWRLVVDEETGELRFSAAPDDDVERQLHRTIQKVGDDIERLAFNTAIASMIEFVNCATGTGVSAEQFDRFVRILAPFVPHFGEELWHRMGHEDSVACTDWPSFDESMLVDDLIEVPVQILGKLRSRISVPHDADESVMETAALADERIAELLEGKTVRKVVVVPGRLVNIVAN